MLTQHYPTNKMKNKIPIIFLILIIILLTSCKQDEQIGKVLKEKITLTTEDEINLKANFYPQETNKALILLHQYNKNKSSWDSFANEFRQEGYNILALDLRGHGESDLNINTLTKEDFNNIVLDVKAAFEYLAQNEIHQISLIGASIGANTALNFAADEPRIQKIVLLSPGLDYKGIQTSNSINTYNRPLLIIVGGLDEYSYNSSNQLFDWSPSRIKLHPYKTDLHGTDIINQLPESRILIKEWLKNN